jgi:hypothetical protein
MKCRRDAGLIPHDQPGGPLVANLAAFWQQISPIMPVLPTVPTHKSSAVYNLGFEAFHGMEEVIGSIQTRFTNLSHLSLERRSILKSLVGIQGKFGQGQPFRAARKDAYN